MLRSRILREPAVAAWLFVCAAAISACASRAPAPAPPPVALETPAPTPSPTARRQTFEATAYSIKGKTASGARARPGVVAADPRILPLGSRIRVHGADGYSGEYTVADTGRSIKGREIDIFIADPSAARRFGRRKVEVEMLD
jgi:3D (Asp-Asp-Asp) domain-containing protein